MAFNDVSSSMVDVRHI